MTRRPLEHYWQVQMLDFRDWEVVGYHESYERAENWIKRCIVSGVQYRVVEVETYVVREPSMTINTPA